MADREITMGMLVKDLTVGELMELTNYAATREKLEAQITEYKEQVEGMKDARESVEDVFSNVRLLKKQATSPFELRTVADVDKFVETLRVAVDGKNVIVIAMALAE